VEPEKTTAEAAKVAAPDMTPPSLPVQYQQPSYLVGAADKDELDSQADDVVLKVKPLDSQKKLNISWDSDVNQNIGVDVDIQANDDFYQAIDHLLRQVDYFYEMQGKTIVIKFRETRQFHIAMPFTTQHFTTGTGGNVLGGDVGGEGIAKNVEGTIKLTSEKNEFDVWKNIESNLKSILEIKSIRTVTETVGDTKVAGDTKGSTTYSDGDRHNRNTQNKTDEQTKTTETNYTEESGGKDFYLIDKPVGLITVTAPRPTIKKMEAYFTSLQRELYKQISIEAKIIEVQLLDSSSIGINWDSVLRNFSITGALGFGSNTVTTSTASTLAGTAAGTLAGTALNTIANTIGTVTNPDGSITTTTTINNNPNDSTNNSSSNGSSNGTNSTTQVMSSGQVWPNVSDFASSVRINTADFGVFLNALKTQGNTKVLSNPKISTMNGQPAMITVGQNITYIDKIEVDVDAQTGVRTYSAETARVLSGVGLALTATVLNNNEIIMNLVPVTSELAGAIQYRKVGEGEVGLPVVNVREMSTTVRVKDGEMLVIGGLISDVNEEVGNFAPVLGDIPLLKYLFGHEEKIKNKRELIILLKPRII